MTVRPRVSSDLIKKVKEKYPEMERLKAADIVDLALRSLLKEEET